MGTSSDDNFGAPEPGSIGYNFRSPDYDSDDLPTVDSNHALYWSPIDDHYRAVMLEDTVSMETAAAAWRAYADRYGAAASAVRVLGQNLSNEWTSPEAKNRFLREVGMLTASLDEWAAQGISNAVALENLAPTVQDLKTQMRTLYLEYIAEARRLKAEDDTPANETDNPLELFRDIDDLLNGSRLTRNTENYSKRSRTEILDPLATAYDRAFSALGTGTHYQGRTDAQIPSGVAGFGGAPAGAPQAGAPGAPSTPNIAVPEVPTMPAAPTIPGPSAVAPPGVLAPLTPPARPSIAPLVAPAAPNLSPRPQSAASAPMLRTPPISAPSAAGTPLGLRGRAGAATPGTLPTAAPPTGGLKPQPPNLAAANAPGTAPQPSGSGTQPGAPASVRPPANLTGRNAPPTNRTPPLNPLHPTLGGRTTNRPRSPIGADPKPPVTHATPTNLPGRSGVIDRRTPKPITVTTEVPPSLRAPKPGPARVPTAYGALGLLSGRAGNAPVKASEQIPVMRPSLTGRSKLGATAATSSNKRRTPEARKLDRKTPMVGGTELFEVTPAPEGPGVQKKPVNGRIARAE